MKTRRALLLCLIALGGWAADGFSGTWINQDDGSTTIATIQVTNGRLEAQVVEDGYPYRLSGTVNGTRATINLLIEDDVIPGTLDLVNGGMVATVEGQRYDFVRHAPQQGPQAWQQPGQQQGQQPGQQAWQQPGQQPGQQPPPGNGGGQAAPAAGQVVLQRTTLRDPGMQNMESHTMLVPKGWQVTGGAFWASPNYFKVMPSQNIRVTSPHGAELILAPHIVAFDFLPSAQSIQLGMQRPTPGASSNGYPVIHLPTDDAAWRQMLSQGIAQEVPGATGIEILEMVMIPELTALKQRQLAPLKAGQQPGAFCEGAVFAVSARYTANGQTWEQLNIFGLTTIGFDSEFGRNVHWSVEPNICYRAPEGQLVAALPLLATIANSLGHTPQWQQMVTDHARKIHQTPNFSPNVVQTASQSVGDIMFEGWKNRENITSTSQRRVVESIHGVNTYQTSSGQVQLPTGYDRVYTNQMGDYVLTNDAFYQPNTDPAINSQNWQALQAVP